VVDLEFVKSEEKYWEFIRKLRTMDGVTQGFIEQKDITTEQQQEYMKEFNNNFYICLYKGDPAGYIGIIENDIRVATHPQFQGKGIGSFMINRIIEIYPSAYAKVKIDNIASYNLFRKCGFKVNQFVAEKYYVLEKRAS
jgi:GNAT superfamily N-acetyltransferase